VFNPNLPFGGVGYSGQGALHGQIGFDQCSHLKPVLDRSASDPVAARYSLLSSRYPPFTARNWKALSGFNKYAFVMVGDLKKYALVLSTVTLLGLVVKVNYFPSKKSNSPS
jgi:aldehyde dehydrogenase (NAD+)